VKDFEYTNPATLKEAVDLLGAQWGETEILAGGTDLLALMKDFIVTPKRLIDVKGVRELSGIQTTGGLRLGATSTLEDVVRNSAIASRYKAIHQAAAGVPSPQIRNRGTVGGDLTQRPRCWYFRLGYGLLGQKDGKSLIPAGDNRYHAIFGNEGPAYFVNPSSLAPALIAMNAEVTIQGPKGRRRVRASEFFVTPKSNTGRENILAPNEILTDITVPANVPVTSATYEIRQKLHLDWPLAAASAVLTMNNDTVRSARIVLGHVAPIPWRAPAAEAAIAGKTVTDQTAEAAGEAAVRGATPLSRNAYKIQLAKVAVKRAILAAAGKETP